MSLPPLVCLIGAQKAGTTFRAGLLGEHPRIELSRPKEPDFFTRHWDRGVDWYLSRFSRRDDVVLLDASTSYSLAPLDRETGGPASSSKYAGVPKRIRESGFHTRFIYVLRDPVQRAWSAYWHDVRNGTEKAGFRDAIAHDSVYLRGGNYHGQLARYLEYFPRQDILILFFEQLRSDPGETVRRCCRFLGLGEDFTPATFEARNRTYTYNAFARLLDRALAPAGGIESAISLFKPLVPNGLRNLAGQVLTREIPPLAQTDREYLEEYYRVPNRELAALLDTTLPPAWKT